MNDNLVEFPEQEVKTVSKSGGFFKKHLNHKSTPHFFSLFCLVLLLLASSWLYVLVESGMSVIESGTYFGKFSGSVVASKNESDFILESKANKDIKIYLKDSQKISRVLKGQVPENSNRPLVVKDGALKISLRGKKKKQSYIGTYKTTSGRDGVWEISKVSKISDTTKDTLKSDAVELQLKFVELQGRYENVNKRLSEVDDKLRFVKVVLDDPKEERERTQEKINMEDKKLKIDKEELKDRETESRELWKKVLLSQKITSYGNLVSQSREITEKENRWYRSMLRTGKNDSSKNTLYRYNKAVRIQKVEREVLELMPRVERLRSMKRRYDVGVN